jgi:hypothetical protein
VRRCIKSSLGLALLPVALVACPAQAAAAVQSSDKVSGGSTLTRSPDGGWRKIVTGRLKNGVRFAILPRRGNEPGVGLLVRNEGGFIAERRPGEQGLAHLIEHIAFLSPTAKEPNDFRHLVRIGLPLTFPAPNAGSTSWRETNYYLSTRTTAEADLDTLLTLFRGAATDLTFRADAVDAARAEVTREMADKKLGNEIFAHYIAAVAPGSPGDVINAQNSDDVPSASIETIRSLYHRLYRPAAMMIVVVGNVDVTQTRTLIEKRFGDWTPVKSEPSRTSYPLFNRDRINRISFSALPQGRKTTLMTVVMPTPPAPPTRDRQARGTLMDMLLTRAINDRLAMSQRGTPPGKAGIFIENAEQGYRQILLWDNFADDRWQSAVANLRRTTCDLLTTGFTIAEWTAAQHNVIVDLEHRTGEMVKVPNVELAKELSHALADDRELIPPNELLRYARAMLPEIDRRSGSDWWRQQWRRGVEHLRVEAPELEQIADQASTIRAAANGAVAASTCKISQSGR